MPDMDPGAADGLEPDADDQRTPPGGAAAVLTLTADKGQAPRSSETKTNAENKPDPNAGSPDAPKADDKPADPEIARVRQEAARYRTELKAAQSQLAERDQSLESTRNDLTTQLNAAQTERDTLRAELNGIRYQSAVADAIGEANALRPAKLVRLIDQDSIKVNEETGQPDARSLSAAVDRLRADYPEEFRDAARLLGGDAGAGRGNGSAPGGDMNRMLRAALGRS